MLILTAPPKDRTSRKDLAEVQEIREVVDPWEMLTDWLNVIHWVHGEPKADHTRIGLWERELLRRPGCRCGGSRFADQGRCEPSWRVRLHIAHTRRGDAHPGI